MSFPDKDVSAKESHVEEAWAAEVERRNAEIESGVVSMLSGPEAVDRLLSDFQ